MLWAEMDSRRKAYLRGAGLSEPAAKHLCGQADRAVHKVVQGVFSKLTGHGIIEQISGRRMERGGQR